MQRPASGWLALLLAVALVWPGTSSAFLYPASLIEPGLLAFLPGVIAQITPAGGIQLQDEGVPKGRIGTLNCKGAGVDCAASGGLGTLTVTPGASGTGTTNTLTKFTDGAAGTIGDSLLSESGSVVTVAGGFGYAPTLGAELVMNGDFSSGEIGRAHV